MTDQEINIALSKIVPLPFSTFNVVQYRDEKRPRHYPCVDYVHDLNAMHEAEKCFTDVNQHRDYVWHWLIEVCGHRRMACCATARQRAEAFLRVKGLWKD